MTDLDLWIKRHNRRLVFGLFLQRAGEWLAAFLFLFGACVLTSKLFLPQFWPHVLWLGLWAVPILLLAARSASRRSFSHTDAVALLDRQLRGGGLVMALAETDDPAWQDRLPQTPELWKRKLPKIRPVRFFRLVGWPMVFSLGALLVPLRNPKPAMGFSPEVGQQATSQLGDMVGLLEDSHVLPPEETKELKTVIEQLSKETEHSPLTNEKWETVDRLREELTTELLTNERSLSLAREAAAKLLAGEGEQGGLTPGHQAELEKKVLEALQAMSDRGALPELPKELAPHFQQLLKQGQLQLAKDPKLRRQLLSQMQQLFNRRSGDLQKVRSQFDRVFAQRPERFADRSRTPGSDEDGFPAPGGTGGGRSGGQVPWGKETDERQEKFKQIVLPPGFWDNPTNQVTGVTPGKTSPRPEIPSQNVSDALPKEFGAASGREVRSHELRPRHRDVVKKYFQRSAEDGETGRIPEEPRTK